MITIQSADSALKSFYLDAVKEALDTKVNPFLAQLERTSSSVVGKDVRQCVRFGVSGGIGAGSETGALPTAGEAKRLQLVATLKNLYGSIEISDKALRAASNNEGAFVNVLNDEMQSLIQNAKMNFGRMLYGDGTGLLAKVTAVDGNVITVDNVSPFVEGMLMDVYDASGYAYDELKGVEVVGVDRVNGTIIIDSDKTGTLVETGAKFYMQGSKGYELTGLAALFGNKPIYGCNRSEHTLLNGIVKENTGTITEEIMQEYMDKVEENTGAKTNFIICSWGVRRALIKYFRQQGVTLPTMEIAGGQALSFNGVPIVVDRFCPKQTMYMLNTDDFKLHQLCDWKWLEGEDGKILKQIPGKPIYTATLVKYAEMVCSRPGAQVCLRGITEA